MSGDTICDGATDCWDGRSEGEGKTVRERERERGETVVLVKYREN
jgi:hypothetical protein